MKLIDELAEIIHPGVTGTWYDQDGQVVSFTESELKVARAKAAHIVRRLSQRGLDAAIKSAVEAEIALWRELGFSPEVVRQLEVATLEKYYGPFIPME